MMAYNLEVRQLYTNYRIYEGKPLRDSVVRFVLLVFLLRAASVQCSNYRGTGAFPPLRLWTPM